MQKRNNLDGSSVRAAKLDWCNFGTEATAEAACAAAGFGIAGDDGIGADRWPDVLLGADCCYSETMGDSLLEAIAYILSHAPEGSRCYIVNGWPNRGLRRFETLIGAREALQAEEARAKENGSEEVDDVHRPFVDDDDTTQSQEEHYGDDKVEDANTSSSRRRRSSPRGLETLKLISCERITGFASHAHHLYCIGSVARETAAAAPAESIVSSTPPKTPPSTPPKPKRTVAAVAAIDDDYNDTAPPTLCALVKAAEAEAHVAPSMLRASLTSTRVPSATRATKSPCPSSSPSQNRRRLMVKACWLDGRWGITCGEGHRCRPHI